MTHIRLINGVERTVSTKKETSPGIVKIDNDLEVVDNNIVRHTGTNRLQSKNKTPFQKLLDGLLVKNVSINDPMLEKKARLVLKMPSMQTGGKTKMFSSDDQAILDAWNDSSRRFFETNLAKKFLYKMVEKNGAALEALIDDMTEAFLSEYDEHGFENADVWRQIVAGKRPNSIKDPNLAGFVNFRASLLDTLASAPPKAKQLILKLYNFHYLTHQSGSLPSYKQYHPAGTLESYTENSTFYTSRSRGRIMGFGFNRGSCSQNLGIMRNIDPSPADFRLSKNSRITRCPDRLYLRKPSAGDYRNQHSFQHQAFSTPENSIYVNGLSGSTLLEINATLLYFILVQKKFFGSNGLDVSAFTENNGELLKDYWLMIGSLFVYFEGGHTFTEILSVFKLDRIQGNIESVLKVPRETFSPDTLLFDRPEMLELVKESLLEAAQYQKVKNAKREVYQELRGSILSGEAILKVSQEINSILDKFYEFTKDKNNFHSLDAQTTAFCMYYKLCAMKQHVFTNPTIDRSERIKQEVDKIINDSIPVFRDDLSVFQKIFNMIVDILNIFKDSLFPDSSAEPYEKYLSKSSQKASEVRYAFDKHLIFSAKATLKPVEKAVKTNNTLTTGDADPNYTPGP